MILKAKRILFFFLTVIFMATISEGKLRYSSENDQAKEGKKKTEAQTVLKIIRLQLIQPVMVDRVYPPLFTFARIPAEAGTILLGTAKPKSEIIKIDRTGKLLTRFAQKGEGPGELKAIESIQVVGQYYVATDSTKAVFFNPSGKFIKEKKIRLNSNLKYFVDEDRYLCNIFDFEGSGPPIRHLVLIDINTDKAVAGFLKDARRSDIGMTIIGSSRQYHGDITPDYKYAFLPISKNIVCGLSDDKRLYLMNLEGKVIKSRSIDFEEKRIEPDDRDRIVKSCASLKPYPFLYEGIIKKIPKNWFVIVDIKPLPRDFFAVFLGIGYKIYEIRVFDKELNEFGKIVFPDQLLSNIGDLRRILFFERGFFAIEESDSENQYAEYQILNLKDIFN